ncbi:uncharacterized protein LOC116846875 [Odontomachus brunneus]|uniref:uncharacterized protein LOC116846875 n=1 Tax=Odontomachus brunneus TaxID=486640 RepID=UPI0013F21FD7|nr:uncharacterized protein LOC116846875 [Odontomachus brunneus]
MIRYCSKHHQQKYEDQHMDMCKSLQRIKYIYKARFNVTFRFNQEEWIKTRKELKTFVRSKLTRDLETYEKHMILFARSCLICHQQFDLSPCLRCYSSNYCCEHKEAFQNQHYFNCNGLKLYFDLALKLPHDYNKCRKNFFLFPDEDKPVADMNTFILQYIRKKGNVNKSDTLEEYICSEYVSGPLTLYYKMKDLNLLNIFTDKGYMCVVHIIAASSVDKEYLSAWEILLHLLDEINHLKIVMIGSELNDKCNYINVCFRCKSIYKKFSFESYRMLYHTYVNSEYYIRPNVILGFQTDFSDVRIWSAPLIELRNQDCPFLVTAKSKIKSDQNISNIERVLGELLNLIHNDENKFSSSMPCRDFENDSVFYRNKYVAVFLNIFPLMWSSSSIQM